MRLVKRAIHAFCRHTRFYASYGMSPLTHKELISSIGTYKEQTQDVIQLLDQVEEMIGQWKLNRWEMRIPPLLPAKDKETLRCQLDVLKGLALDFEKRRVAVEADFQLVYSITGVAKESVRGKNRLWLQEETEKLRWLGEIKKAVDLREAFLRLEVYGPKDYMLLERLCCVYGMGLQGTFEEAFGNYIVEDPISKKHYVHEQNPFRELLVHILNRYTQIDIIYDFLGFNLANGYRRSLCRYMAYILRKRSDLLEEQESKSRLVFSDEKGNEILFDVCDSRQSIVSCDCAQGLPDFLYAKGRDLTLITIASENIWMRNRQLPHRKQMEGIARRASFVLGIPYSEVRIRNLFLPPLYMDKKSLVRLNEVVLGLTEDEQDLYLPWLPLYNKELDSNDVDYCELTKTTNKEEWVKL